ncbi:MAG: hypothetical protein FK734_21545 [Asgard group archaeon]|nr:hypothetical protein [Asgard group archaeon]
MSNDSLKTEIEATTEVFSEFGFTRYDSLVLSILTAIGTATVKEIHQFTDVPLPKVYQTLENLVRKGFVKQHSKTRPVEFTAYAPKIIMRKIEEENRKKELKLKSSLDRLAEHTQPSFTGDIVPFSGLENFLRIGEGLISNATKHISFAGSAVTLGHFADELRDAKDRGVKLRSMIISQLSKLKPELNPNNYQN